ncbi:MAG: 3-deoxy-manno-octulosonate cytidylyltransferase [Crocinitomicaceae bacterium]|nr:3-deoxy-manno-octulosonate cytidylyltransferase [Crocinitomicaceae bacterium]MDG1776992.1 3-deoxy-manno-octulosonate cytidylyltransferase [Crocinitomicaceae bacterium]
MNIVGIIPARYASSRFPGKPLVDLNGKTMIQRVYEGAKKSQKLSEVIVATDDQRIFDEVLRFGGKVQMTSEQHTTGTDRCGEVAQSIDADIIINIQGDEPLVDYRQLDQLCNAFQDNSVTIATLGIKSVSEADYQNPNRIKIVLDHQQNALYFSRSPIPNTANATPEVQSQLDLYRHIGLYAYRKATLMELIKLKKTLLEQAESLEQLRWLYNGYNIRVVETTIETPNIDVPEDLEKVLRAL